MTKVVSSARNRAKKTANNGQRGCLCADGNRYSVECCDEDSIYNQGIGRDRKVIQLPADNES